MSKIRITQTNGATAEDISDAIGAFLGEREKEQGKKPEPEEE